MGPRSRDCIVCDNSVIRASFDILSDAEVECPLNTEDNSLDTPANISEMPAFLDSKLDLKQSNSADVCAKRSETFAGYGAQFVTLKNTSTMTD